MRPLRSSLPGGLYEIATRITGNELLAVPTKEVTDPILGVIAYAQRHHDVKVHAFVAGLSCPRPSGVSWYAT